MSAVLTSRQAALNLIEFCDGLEEGGLVEYARRARVVARDLLVTLDALDGERSARVALQERCKRLDEIVGRHALEGLR